MRTAATIIGFVLMVVASTPAPAQMYFCNRPSKPYIPSYSTQKFEMESAQSSVEQYTRRMREYVDCIGNEQTEAASEYKRVTNEWNDAVSSYNNR